MEDRKRQLVASCGGRRGAATVSEEQFLERRLEDADHCGRVPLGFKGLELRRSSLVRVIPR